MSNPDLMNMATESMKNMRLQDLKEDVNLEQYDIAQQLREKQTEDSRAQGRGRIARIHRRLLVIDIEKRIMQYQSYIEQGRDKDAETVFGLLIYSLERL